MRAQLFDIQNVEELKTLFKLWKKAHEVEIDEVFAEFVDKNINKGEFETEVYKKKGNVISSHFAQFFEKKCNSKVCPQAKELGRKAWEIALKKAFNMDGTYKNYDVKEGGYQYICLLKEANDTKKMCINDYLDASDVVNEWIVNDGQGVCGRKYKSDMLNKLNEAFYKLIGNEKSGENEEDFDFKNEVAFMNVNKRGGTFRTAGRDETAVIQYAARYKEFILKEIDILTKNEKATVFVCGSKSYFERLMIAFFEKEVQKEIKDKRVLVKDKITFKQIPHPSYWKVTSAELAEEMRKG